ncbi:hypothetical protein BV25DRAFT_1781053, partial [Artomyces pyxidatus]
FASADHPLFASHVSRLRAVPYVPVLLGPSLPRADRSPEEHEQWCRAMMILFKPWRSFADLKGVGDSWTMAFDAHCFPAHLLKIMDNINVEHECKDAREQYDEERR